MTDDSSRRVRILRVDVSRKIAAGEVIDRPLSVVRELLDNAIDAGAGSIDVAIEGGGEARIRVVDDGAGMSREDLSLCWQRHATSKIQAAEDLYRVRTLGFRGEALASIAACARLTVVARPRGAPTPEEGEAGAHRLIVEGGRQIALEACQGPPGTAVDVADLFFNLPARRRFLKSPGAESALCRQAFLEKALPHPGISFRFSGSGELKHFFPALEDEDYKGRVASAFGFDPALIYGLRGAGSGIGGRAGSGTGGEIGGGIAVHAVVGRPELNRRDRKMLQLYVNRRRIFDYGLIQAIEYAYSQYLPGGLHPVAFLFLELDPAEVDFNIHPAKREVRFRDLAAIRQEVNAILREFLRRFDLRSRPSGEGTAAEPLPWQPGALSRPSDGERTLGLPIPGGSRPSELFTIGPRSLAGGPVPLSPRASEGEGPSQAPLEPVQSPVYRGQLFRLFLLVEYGNSLYVVDQHAAHERILFEEMKTRKQVAQELLMPLRVEAGSRGEGLLEKRDLFLDRFGIRLERAEDGAIEVAALPEDLLALEEDELLGALLGEEGSLDQLADRIYSLAACRLAVKDGQELDVLTARELVRRAFALDNARCPHGRPIWMELSREALERAVSRE